MVLLTLTFYNSSLAFAFCNQYAFVLQKIISFSNKNLVIYGTELRFYIRILPYQISYNSLLVQFTWIDVFLLNIIFFSITRCLCKLFAKPCLTVLHEIPLQIF